MLFGFVVLVVATMLSDIVEAAPRQYKPIPWKHQRSDSSRYLNFLFGEAEKRNWVQGQENPDITEYVMGKRPWVQGQENPDVLSYVMGKRLWGLEEEAPDFDKFVYSKRDGEENEDK